MKNFLSVRDAGHIEELIQKAIQFKQDPLSSQMTGKGKRLGLLFMNPSLRTRISTQIAAQNLGMEVIVLNGSQDSWTLEFEEGVIMNGKSVEHVKEAAAVLGSYFDILGVRTFPSLKDREEDYSEKVLQAFQQHAGIPIISLESATRHPLQSLADLITITEQLSKSKKERPKIVLSWAPHIKALPQSVANSFAEWVNAWGKADFTIACPKRYELKDTFIQQAHLTHDQDEALKDADFVYVKNWSSYENYGNTPPVSEDWMLTSEKLSATHEAKVMHCLPVRRNVVISDDVLDSSHSLVVAQAANRVWAAQTVISEILKELS